MDLSASSSTQHSCKHEIRRREFPPPQQTSPPQITQTPPQLLVKIRKLRLRHPLEQQQRPLALGPPPLERLRRVPQQEPAQQPQQPLDSQRPPQFYPTARALVSAAFAMLMASLTFLSSVILQILSAVFSKAVLGLRCSAVSRYTTAIILIIAIKEVLIKSEVQAEYTEMKTGSFCRLNPSQIDTTYVYRDDLAAIYPAPYRHAKGCLAIKTSVLGWNVCDLPAYCGPTISLDITSSIFGSTQLCYGIRSDLAYTLESETGSTVPVGPDWFVKIELQTIPVFEFGTLGLETWVNIQTGKILFIPDYAGGDWIKNVPHRRCERNDTRCYFKSDGTWTHPTLIPSIQGKYCIISHNSPQANYGPWVFPDIHTALASLPTACTNQSNVKYPSKMTVLGTKLAVNSTHVVLHPTINIDSTCNAEYTTQPFLTSTFSYIFSMVGSLFATVITTIMDWAVELIHDAQRLLLAINIDYRLLEYSLLSVLIVCKTRSWIATVILLTLTNTLYPVGRNH